MPENGTKNAREAELLAAFEGIDENIMSIIRPTITETAYLEGQLEALRALPKIRIHPTEPQRQQATPAAKLYKEFLQQYTNCIKVLAAVQRKDAPEEESPLRQWLEERRKQNAGA